MWIVYSLGNRKYWYASTEELIELSRVFAEHMHCDISEGFINSLVNGWYMMSDSYIERLKDTLDFILSKEVVDEATVMSLSMLRDVLEGGNVVLG
ncbi:hypothetical protein JZK55_08770 [Dissulfurispira thermophila]|uniref:Uncharacterized protein n=2 Tax=root TaxID=1 RepID=A0A7G1GZM6_9BACT|nr:hypothetical protein [Dissulfurispira thermophila]BCB95955.1 hypothetical protein JZK55_08770 [Dissulfurispira thermophila]